MLYVPIRAGQKSWSKIHQLIMTKTCTSSEMQLWKIDHPIPTLIWAGSDYPTITYLIGNKESYLLLKKSVPQTAAGENFVRKNARPSCKTKIRTQKDHYYMNVLEISVEGNKMMKKLKNSLLRRTKWQMRPWWKKYTQKFQRNMILFNGK